jgi:hypothetical protein
MRSPPGGVPAHSVAASARQILTIAIRRSGMMKSRGVSGGTVGAAEAAGGGGGGVAVAAGCAAGEVRLGFDGEVVAGLAADGAAAAGGICVCTGAGDGDAAAAGGGAAGDGLIALTAALQDGDNLAVFLRKQLSASMPPGVTPEQFAMKSERQFERMALVCAAEGCCACAGTAVRTGSKQASAHRQLIVLCDGPIPVSPMLTSFRQIAAAK